jgi:hypothetical protein
MKVSATSEGTKVSVEVVTTLKDMCVNRCGDMEYEIVRDGRAVSSSWFGMARNFGFDGWGGLGSSGKQVVKTEDGINYKITFYVDNTKEKDKKGLTIALANVKKFEDCVIDTQKNMNDKFARTHEEYLEKVKDAENFTALINLLGGY